MKKVTKIIRQRLREQTALSNRTLLTQIYNEVVAINPQYRRYRIEEEFCFFHFRVPSYTDRQISDLLNQQIGNQIIWTPEKVLRMRQIFNGTYVSSRNRTSVTMPIATDDVVTNDSNIPTTEISEPPPAPTKKKETKKEVKTEVIEQIKDLFDNERTFGVEIEFLYPSRIRIESIIEAMKSKGLNVCSGSRNDKFKNSWKFTNDGSVTAGNEPNYNGGYEIVSPVLKGKEGLEQLKTVSIILSHFKCRVNSSCGCHIHFGVTNETVNSTNVQHFFRNLTAIYSNYQNDINKILPHSRRNNSYCYALPQSEYSRLKNLQKNFEMDDLNFLYLDRRRVVNLDAWQKHGTVEFRQHSGTFNYNKIKFWVTILMQMMKKAEYMMTKRVNVFSYDFKGFEKEFEFTKEMIEFAKERELSFSNKTQSTF